MNGTSSDLIKQIHATRTFGLNGLILFDYAHISQYYIDTLTESVFKPNKKEVCINTDLTENSDKTNKNIKKGKKKKWKKKINRKDANSQEYGLIVAESTDEYIKTKRAQLMLADVQDACAQLEQELELRVRIKDSSEVVREKEFN